MLYAPIDSDGGVYVFSSCIIPENGRSDGDRRDDASRDPGSARSEKDELATVMRQLDQVRAALDRARTASLQATPHDGRYFFDYPRAQADIQTMQEGIDRYLTPSRAQPRNGSAVTGEYRRERP